MTSERNHLRIHIAIRNSLFSVHVTSHSKYTQWVHLNTQSSPHNNKVRHCTQRRRQSTKRTTRLGGKRSKVNVNSDDDGRRKFKKSEQQNRRHSKLFKSLRKRILSIMRILGTLFFIKESVEMVQFFLPYLEPLLKLLSNLIM